MDTKTLPVETNYPVVADITKEQLISDFKVVISDAEALIKITANQGGVALTTARAKAEKSIAKAKTKLADTEAALLVRTKAAAKATDVYVHENPWRAIGISAGIGLIIGFLIRR